MQGTEVLYLDMGWRSFMVLCPIDECKTTKRNYISCGGILEVKQSWGVIVI